MKEVKYPQLSFDLSNTTKTVEKPITVPQQENEEQKKFRVMEEIMREIPRLLIIDKNKIIRGPYKTGSLLVEISIDQSVILRKVPSEENPEKSEYRTCEPVSGIGLLYRNKITIGQGEKIIPCRQQRAIREDEKPEVAERLYQNWLRIKRFKSAPQSPAVSRPKES